MWELVYATRGRLPNTASNYTAVIFEHAFEPVVRASKTGSVPGICPLVEQGLRVNHGGVTEQEALEIIGRLIKQGRLEKGLRALPFAKVAEVDTKTLASMEKGTRVAWETNQRKVETALGWRAGAIQEVLDHAPDIPVESVTLASLQEGAAEASWEDLAAEESRTEHPVTRANQLTDEELLAELSYRFRNYKNRFLAES